jgi:two-component system chemotaxis response regulator CheY
MHLAIEPAPRTVFAPSGEPSPERGGRRRGSGGSLAAGKRVRVLVVDDDASFLAAAVRALESGMPAFDVDTADTGRAAVALLESSTAGDVPLPDLVLLDYHLPDTTAPTLLRRFAEDPILRELPVLVLTRDAREEARDQAVQAGASDFASKPSRVHALREIVIRFWETYGPASDDPSR